MSTKRITPEQEAEIVSRYQDGHKVVTILHENRITPDALYRVLRRNGVTLRDAPRKKGLSAKDAEMMRDNFDSLMAERNQLLPYPANLKLALDEIARLNRTIEVLNQVIDRLSGKSASEKT